MSEISDELRRYCKGLYKGAPNYMTLTAIADRIDAEMVELPRGKDGKPIHFGDTVFVKDDPETSWNVRYIELRLDREPSIGIESNGVNTYRPPSLLTHERPDSWERIANDMRAEIESLEHGSFASNDALDALGDYEARIRKLAKRGTA